MSEMIGAIGSGRVADQGAAAIKARQSSDIRKVAVASAIGNMIEYYDFTLYATATALVFNKIFFPSTDPLVGSLLAFATFFVGYCARPLGGVLFGHFGDRVGRKTALLLTILIMGLGTFLIGFMPTYEQSKLLANLMVSTGELAGTCTVALLTSMEEPLGRAIETEQREGAGRNPHHGDHG